MLQKFAPGVEEKFRHFDWNCITTFNDRYLLGKLSLSGI